MLRRSQSPTQGVGRSFSDSRPSALVNAPKVRSTTMVAIE